MKKRSSIFGRKESNSDKPAWSDDCPKTSIIGEGHFWKKGHSIPRTWKRRDYKIRQDAMLFYFDNDRVGGSIDLGDISIVSGPDKNIANSGVGTECPIAADLNSVVDNKITEIVFDNKNSADHFCRLLIRVVQPSCVSNVEAFVKDFHWKEATRLLGADELDMDPDGDINMHREDTYNNNSAISWYDMTCIIILIICDSISCCCLYQCGPTVR